MPGCLPFLKSCTKRILSGTASMIQHSCMLRSDVPGQHTTTGRADYFGPFVNRAARYGMGAAHGGQIVAPMDVVQKVVAEWTGRPCPALALKPAAGPYMLTQCDMSSVSAQEVCCLGLRYWIRVSINCLVNRRWHWIKT